MKGLVIKWRKSKGEWQVKIFRPIDGFCVNRFFVNHSPEAMMTVRRQVLQLKQEGIV